MPYLIEKKNRPALSFDQSFKLRRQPEDKLQARADRKAKSRKPVSTLDRVKVQKRFGGSRLHMTTPKAREMEKKYHSESLSVFAGELMALEEEIYGRGCLDR